MKCPRCNIPIQEHPANACLDALFADLVMKFRRRTITTSLGTFKVYYDDESMREWPIDKWHPSTNISHAMEGVEKVCEDNGFMRFNLVRLSNREKINRWRYFAEFINFEVVFHNSAETAELAITRALILWAMEKTLAQLSNVLLLSGRVRLRRKMNEILQNITEWA